jgi:hypothetical protein
MRAGAPGELAVKDQERQSAEMVAMEVGDEHGADLTRIQSEGLERAERCRAAVQQNRRVAGPAQVDARLVAAAAAESVTRAGEGHGNCRATGCVHQADSAAAASATRYCLVMAARARARLVDPGRLGQALFAIGTT